LKITVIAVGKLKSREIDALADKYEKRLPKALSLKWIEVPQAKGRLSKDEIMKKEAERIREKLPGDSTVAVLSEDGETMDSMQFSSWLAGIRDRGADISFIIGGAEGVHGSLKKEADKAISLSRLTFAHELVRAILSEQIYRAFSIMRGDPYHR